MKESIAKVVAASLLVALSGCVFVRDREPETISTTTTTRHTNVVTPVPATTTVERTTVY
jgi:hypothetical protein